MKRNVTRFGGYLEVCGSSPLKRLVRWAEDEPSARERSLLSKAIIWAEVEYGIHQGYYVTLATILFGAAVLIFG